MRRINVCCSVNSKYFRYLYVMIQSLLNYNHDVPLSIYILNSDLKEDEKNAIKEFKNSETAEFIFVSVDKNNFKKLFGTLTERYSVEVFYRLKIPELLPETVDRVLYLDVDIIVRGSVSELYDMAFEDNFFIACQDMFIGMDEHRRRLFGRDDNRYFNSGVMLWNMPMLRKERLAEKCLDGARELNYDLPCVDQEILNYLYYDNVKYVSAEKYNYLVNKDVVLGTDYKMYDPIILHYAGFNPWAIGAKTEAYLEWWKVAKETPFYTELLEEHLLRTEKSLIESKNQNKNYIQNNETRESQLMDSMRHVFEHCVSNKNIVLFGAGTGMNLFFLEFENRFNIVGVVDNNPELLGCYVRRLGKPAQYYASERLRVEDINVLNSVDWNNTVLVITIKNPRQIINQLFNIGINSVFCLADMIGGNWRARVKAF